MLAPLRYATAGPGAGSQQLRFASSSSSAQPQDASSATRSTVPPRSTHSTYHPRGYGVSEGLRRARRPYLVRNAVTGSLIMGFAVGVYFYSISKVKQDDFSDLADVRAPADGVPAGSSDPQTNAKPAHGHQV